MKKIVPPPTPLEELLAIAKNATQGTAWAVGQGKNNRKRLEWYIYCSSKQQAKRLPLTYRSRKIKIYFCPKPKLLS